MDGETPPEMQSHPPHSGVSFVSVKLDEIKGARILDQALIKMHLPMDLSEHLGIPCVPIGDVAPECVGRAHDAGGFF